MSSFAGYLYAIGAAVTWGVVYTLDQRILKNASPFALVFIDSLLTTIILLPVLYFERAAFSSVYKFNLKLVLIIIASLALAALANYFIYSSIRLLGASTASIFEIAYPFFVVLFSFLAYRAVPNIYFVVGGLMIFLGAALIIFHHS